jgi:hypothetical protein
MTNGVALSKAVLKELLRFKRGGGAFAGPAGLHLVTNFSDFVQIFDPRSSIVEPFHHSRA